MPTKLTGCELLAKSVTLVLTHSVNKTARSCGCKNKKSWLIAVEKAQKEVRRKKAKKSSKKNPIALLCPADDKVVSLKERNDSEWRKSEQPTADGMTVF